MVTDSLDPLVALVHFFCCFYELEAEQCHRTCPAFLLWD